MSMHLLPSKCQAVGRVHSKVSLQGHCILYEAPCSSDMILRPELLSLGNFGMAPWHSA